MLNRSFCLLFLLSVSIIGKSQDEKIKKLIPDEPIGWVSDFEKIFTEEEIKFLDSIVEGHAAKTSDQIAIVTLVVDTADIRTMQEFQILSLVLLKKWGVGQAGKNNGIGIIFSRNLKMIRIEVGEGLTSKLTDEETKNIIDNIIIPGFKKSDYFDGIVKGLLEIINELQ